jgi:hypothetical protein
MEFHKRRAKIFTELTKKYRERREEVKKIFKDFCLENFEFFEESHNVFDMAEFLALIGGFKREDLEPEIDELTLYDVRYVYSKANIIFFKKHPHTMREAERLGYDSVFDMLCDMEDFETRKEIIEKINVSPATVRYYANRCVAIIRKIWYNDSEERVKKLFFGDEDFVENE